MAKRPPTAQTDRRSPGRSMSASPSKPPKSAAHKVPRGPSTSCVHAGEEPDPRSGAVNVPIHLSTTFLNPELADGSKAPYLYTRYTNPSLEAVERKVAALEGAQRSLLFSSGMAAIHAACTAFARPGQTVAVQRGVYGGTTAYLKAELAPFGVKVVPFDAHAARPTVPDGTALVWMESVTNPLLRVADIPRWAEAAHAAGARLGVDATFASPLVQRPLSLGADVVMQSATKYLGGHSDVTAGVLSYGARLHDSLFQRRRNGGGILDPHAAYLLGRGMKTLAIRMERHCENAMALAKAAAKMEGVEVAHYPGLPSHPDHKVAARLLSGGFGGMLTLDLGTQERAVQFRRQVRVILPAPSLGGVESLACLPLESSHAYSTAAERRRDGITDGLVRISVGIEDIGDLVADVEQAVRP